MDLALLQPIVNESALFIREKKILIVADLHIGIEKELFEKGINTFFKTDDLVNQLLKICNTYKPNEIILLGDIKHNIPSSTYRERKDVINFLKILQYKSQVHIIPGNHDGNIQKLVSGNIKLHPSSGFRLDNIGFIHGHRWPDKEIMSCDQIVMAHTHPTVMLMDRLGYKSFENCWVKADFIKHKLNQKYPLNNNPKILILPAFNPLCGGIPVNKDGIAGPLGKIIDIKNAQIFLIDGSSLGTIKNLYYKNE